jgi:polysaccharide biosynthesis protein PslH
VGKRIIVKILDAMAAGTPVVATSYGNVGIEAETRRELLVADESESYTLSIINILRNDDLIVRFSSNCREFVSKYFTLEATIEKFEAACAEIQLRPPYQHD